MYFSETLNYSYHNNNYLWKLINMQLIPTILFDPTVTLIHLNNKPVMETCLKSTYDCICLIAAT